jgi:hypothetical protein
MIQSNDTHAYGFSIMIYEEIRRLPEELGPEELRPFFKRVLENFEDSPESLAGTGDSLVELADNQWHTYEPIDRELREKIVGWISEVWSVNDLRVVQAALALIGTLGLTEFESLLKSSLKSDLRSDVREEIGSALEHFGDHLADPYRGLRK